MILRPPGSPSTYPLFPTRRSSGLVRMEPQADCYAGVWGSSAQDRGLLEPGDVEECLGAAEAVGDDSLGNPSEESWTHGSAEQRKRWFTRGLENGDHEACNTFETPSNHL